MGLKNVLGKRRQAVGGLLRLREQRQRDQRVGSQEIERGRTIAGVLERALEGGLPRRCERAGDA